jgi:hypothetical protein
MVLMLKLYFMTTQNQENLKSNNVLQPLFKLFTNLILFLANLIHL